MLILKCVFKFKPKNALSSLQGLLLCEGSLSHEVPSSSIQAPNKSVIAIFESEVERKPMNEKSILQKYKYKVNLGNHVILHSTSAAIRHFKVKHPDLK